MVAKFEKVKNFFGGRKGDDGRRHGGLAEAFRDADGDYTTPQGALISKIGSFAGRKAKSYFSNRAALKMGPPEPGSPAMAKRDKAIQKAKDSQKSDDPKQDAPVSGGAPVKDHMDRTAPSARTDTAKPKDWNAPIVRQGRAMTAAERVAARKDTSSAINRNNYQFRGNGQYQGGGVSQWKDYSARTGGSRAAGGNAFDDTVQQYEAAMKRNSWTNSQEK